MDDLLAVLGQQRQVLDRLLFRLLETRSLLVTGDVRFLHFAARDIDAAAEAVGRVELTRALLEPAHERPTLRSLAAASTPPLDAILEDHRAAIGHLAAEVGAVIEAITDLAEHDLVRLRQPALATVGPGFDHQPPAGDDLDREIAAAAYEAVLGATARLTLPSLVAFLG